MDLQKLNSEVISRLRSTSKINSVSQCVTELVLNSLDAKSMAIAVRLNLVSMRIQVVDNGEGISKDNMQHVGVRYMTNKLRKFEDLEKHSNFYGFRGEALASIVECSKNVTITSKHINSSQTYLKRFGKYDSEVIETKNRPSFGTTVTVEGFFDDLPVRQNRLKVELELEELKKIIENLVIVRPNVSFSVRNDVNSELILNSKKNDDIITSFKYLHPEVDEEFSLMKVKKHKFTVEALLFKGTSDKRIQYVYVNKRPISSTKIQKFIKDAFHKNQKSRKTDLLHSGNKFPIYVFNIRCPYSQVDILLDPSRTTVEFHNWNLVFRCIEKLIYLFFGNVKKLKKDDKRSIPEEKLNFDCGVLHIQGAFKSFGYKRPVQEPSSCVPEKITKTNLGEIIDEDNYRISYTSPILARNTRRFKKPLPIKSSTLQALPRNMEHSLPQKVDDEKSNLSRFTSDETTGKNLIMDMFLKSTQVYSSEENLNDTKSDETILELESNIVMENNYHKITNGLSKTRSVSVNIRSTRKIRKIKKKEAKNSHGIQMSEMVSKCVQTTLEERNVLDDKEKAIFNNKLAENFTLMFTDTLQSNQTPNFKFVIKKPTVGNSININSQKCCECNCHQKNIFQFNKDVPKINDYTTQKRNSEINHVSQIDNDVQLQNELSENANVVANVEAAVSTIDFVTDTKPALNNLRRSKISNRQFENHSLLEGFVKPKEKSIKKNQFIPKSSPYFKVPETFNNHCDDQNNIDVRTNWIGSYTDFNPIHLSTQYAHKNCIDEYIEPLAQPDKPTNLRNYHQRQDTLNDFTLGSFRTFNPAFKSTQNLDCNNLKAAFRDIRHKNNVDVTDPIFSTCPHNSFLNLSMDNVFLSPRNNVSGNASFGHNFLDQRTIEEEKRNETSRQSNITFLNEKEPDGLENVTENVDFIAGEEVAEALVIGDWEKKRNSCGKSFYINKKTGFATFVTPNENGNQFKFCQRYDFLPRGMSPILKETEHIDMSLSQHKKDLLLEYIMETYKNELFYVKWQNYLQDIDPKTFFEFIYQEKAKEFEECIPNVNKFGSKRKDLKAAIVFNRDLFVNINVIGQVDRKFIAAVESKNQLLVLFDQHAVHERIRLERLLTGYNNKKYTCKEALMFFLPKNDISLLRRHSSYLDTIGLGADFFVNGIGIKEVPICIYTRFANESVDYWSKILQLLIDEILDLLKSARNASSGILPKFMQNLINVEACTGAIKFGDALNKVQCEDLLHNLSQCDLPFQCAHGRPTLVPLLSLYVVNV